MVKVSVSQTPDVAQSEPPEDRRTRSNTDTEPSSVGPSSKASNRTGQPQVGDTSSGLMAVLRIENDAREAATRRELYHVIANEFPRVTRARQAFVFEARVRGGMHAVAATGLVTIDRTVPLLHALEGLATRLTTGKFTLDPDNPVGQGGGKQAERGNTASGEHSVRFFLSDCPDTDRTIRDIYPFRAMLWRPFLARDGRCVGGVLLTRETPWTDADETIAGRLAGTFAHAWVALITARRYKPKPTWLSRAKWSAIPLLLTAMAIPVPMTTLAPLEIVAATPFVVTAPIDGVIDDILIEPNARVKVGDTLLRLNDTALRSQFAVSEREVQVAEARLKRAGQLAFSQARGRHDLGIAKAELALKVAERDFAADQLAHTQIKAARAGIAVFGDKSKLVGKPVATGERIMQIADPANVAVAIHVAVADAMTLEPGADVTLYLDSDPLNPLSARIESADYQARTHQSQQLAFRAIAKLDDDKDVPRLGVRGTAQIFGDIVPLGFYLFRRPIAASRQWLGL